MYIFLGVLNLDLLDSMNITDSDYFTKRTQAAQKKQLSFLGKQFFQPLRKDIKTPHPTQRLRESTGKFCLTENREVHVLSNLSTTTIMHPLGDKNVFVSRKTNLSIEKALS